MTSDGQYHFPRRVVFFSTLLCISTPALAHPGHLDSSFASGLLHPLTGIDHLLTMLMVGLWAGLAFRRHWWVCPAGFVGFMLLGFGYGMAIGSPPFAEMLIIASLGGLGLALAFNARPPLTIAAPIVALFGIGHGFAHGAEIPSGGDALGFVAGVMATTVLLHAAGLALARSVRSWATVRLVARQPDPDLRRFA